MENKKIISGIGKFKFKDEFCIETDFKIEADFDGINKFNSSLITTEVDYKKYRLHGELPFFPWELEGKDSEGKNIFATGMALISQGSGFHKSFVFTSLGFNFNELLIGDSSGLNRIEFFVPNLIIGFDKIQEDTDERNISNISLHYNNNEYSITLQGLNDLTNKYIEIKKKNVDLITVKITIERERNLISYEEGSLLVDRMLELSTIAYGDRINWVYATGYKEEDKVFTILRDMDFSKINPFRQLIEVRSPFELSNFIKNSFNNYISYTEQQRISFNKFINGIHFSAERLNFPAPIISIGSTIEEYAKDILKDIDTHFFPKTIRRKLYPVFSEWIKGNVIPLLQEDDKQDFNEEGIKQKLSAIVQRNLKTRITNLVNYYKIDFDAECIRKFVKKRNSAAHGTYIFEQDDYDIWTEMVSLLERCLLKEFEYKGKYLDWSTSPPEWKTMQ